MSVDSFLICFWQFYISSQTDDFAKKAIFANIQNGLIFRILGVFKGGFLLRITLLCP